MGPSGPQLEEDVRVVEVETDEEQAGGTEETPVRCPAGAHEEPVAVTEGHTEMLPDGRWLAPSGARSYAPRS
jgi:hypothetical protein